MVDLLRMLSMTFADNETQASETNNLKVTTGALKLAGRIMPGAKYPEGHLRRRGI